ncbi:MAG: hypothetical protein ACK4Z5_06255 [Brevundimonas sp.]
MLQKDPPLKADDVEARRKAEREARLAQALRANLRRRKVAKADPSEP